MSEEAVIVHCQGDPGWAPGTPFATDWFGAKPRSQARFSFALQGDVLTFTLRTDQAPQCDHSLAPGSFVAGLWERDVAEFFVRGEGSGYQEFNVSPSGAWWSGYFTDYRQLAREVRCPSARVAADCRPTDWMIRFSVALVDIIPLQSISLTQASLNPAAILFSDPREYLCYGHCQGGEPDFHSAQNYRRVQLT